MGRKGKERKEKRREKTSIFSPLTFNNSLPGFKCLHTCRNISGLYLFHNLLIVSSVNNALKFFDLVNYSMTIVCDCDYLNPRISLSKAQNTRGVLLKLQLTVNSLSKQWLIFELCFLIG